MKNNNLLIESKDNSKLKLIRKLKLKKNRYKEGKFVIESKKMLEEAISNDLDIDFILLREDLVVAFENMDLEGYTLYETSNDLFNQVSTMATPDGFLAVVKFPKIDLGMTDKVLLLDCLQDPGNLGTIIRSAEAFAFKRIYLLNTVDPYNDKTLRASMGSIFRIELVEIEEADLEEITKSYAFFVADMEGTDFRGANYDGPVCLVIGNEANGISPLLFSLASSRIKIPMQGKLESLNAAISASLIMSQIEYYKENR